MIVKNNKYQKEWHNATKPLRYISNVMRRGLQECCVTIADNGNKGTVENPTS
jgi:hypothetical protein